MKPLDKKLISYSKVFKQVSKVLGKEDALKQLELVWGCPECFNVKFGKGAKVDLTLDLIDLFVWMDSPQGQSYWSNIDNKL